MTDETPKLEVVNEPHVTEEQEQEQHAQTPSPRAVPYAPYDVSANAGIAHISSGQAFIALEFVDQGGEKVVFLQPDNAYIFATIIMKLARQAQMQESQTAKLVGPDGKKLV